MIEKEDSINRVAAAINAGASITEIHDALIRSGMSEYDFFLTYKAAELLNKSIKEVEDRLAPQTKRPSFAKKNIK